MNRKAVSALILSSILAQSAAGALAAGDGKEITDRSESVNVYVNTFDKKQTIKGVGGAITWYNDWLTNSPAKAEIYDLLFNKTGLDVLRIKNFYDYKDIDFEKTAAADKENIESAEKAAGKEIPVLMSSWSPAARVKSNGVENGGGTIKKDENGEYMYKEYGEYYAEAVQAYRDAGVKIDYFSIQNEPDFRADYDGCELNAVESEEYAQYSKAFDAAYEAFQELEEPPLMLGPDSMTASFTNIKNMIQPSIDHGDGRVAVIGHHLYAGGSEENPDQYVSSMNKLRDNFPDIPKWQTEYYRGNGVQTAWLITNFFVEEGGEAYIYWDTIWGPDGTLVAIENPWEKSEWTTEKGYKVDDKIYALEHFAKFTDGGHIMVDSSVDYQNSDIKTAAFITPDESRLTIVLTNTKYENSEIKLELNGYNAESSKVYLTNYQDGASDRMADKGALDSDMTVELPAQSVMTIDMTGSKGEEPEEIMTGEKAPEKISEKVSAQYGTPVIDGETDELWSRVPQTRMINAAHGDHGASGVFRTMWDENNLYALVEVTDEALDDTSENAHEQDSVEFFINESHSKPDAYENGDAQYRVNYKNVQSFGSGTPDRENFKTAVRMTDTGYVVEAAIPLQTITGRTGTVIGFDVQINDSHGSGVRDYILKWSDPSDNTWSSLEEIGDVEFAGASDSEKNISVTVNGVPVVFTDCEPVIMNDRVMLPIRAVAETAGLAVDWDEAKRTVGIRGVGETFEYPENADGGLRVYANGEPVDFTDQEPVIVNDRTLIPVRAAAEALGMDVEWEESTNTVIIVNRITD